MTQTVSRGRPFANEAAAVVDYLVGIQEGCVVPHCVIEEHLERHSKRPSPRYYAIMQRVKRDFLNDTSIQLIAIGGTGYKLATGNDQLRHGIGHTARAMRMSRKGARIAEKICDARLSKAEREARDRFVEASKYHHAMMRADRKPILVLLGRDKHKNED